MVYPNFGIIHIERNEVLRLTISWMNLENILNERNHLLHYSVVMKNLAWENPWRQKINEWLSGLWKGEGDRQ